MKKKLWYTLFSVAVTAGIFSWLFSHVTLREVADLVRNADLRGVALFLLASLTMSIFRAWRYLVLLRASGYAPGRLAMYLVVLVRNTFSDLLPARIGTLIYIYVITTRLGIPFGAATSSFALAFIFDMIALVPLIAWAALGLGGGSVWILLGFGALLAGLTLAVLAGLPSMVRLVNVLLRRCSVLGVERIRRWRAALEAVVEDLRKAREAGIYGRVLVLSLMVRIFKYASLYLFLFALVAPLGYGWARLPIARVFTGLCAAEAAASLPVSGIAGFGAYEGAWALIFQLLLFPAHLAKMTSIAHHLFTQVYGYSLGGLALLILLLPFGRRALIPQHEPHESTARFALKWLSVLVAVTVVGGLLYRVCPAAAARPPPAESRPSEPELTALKHLAERVEGRIIFQRPDGIYMARLGEPFARLLVACAAFPRFSPDGQRVAFVKDRRIAWIRTDGSDEETLASAADPRAVAFHPRGDELYFTDGRMIRAVHLKTRKLREVVSGFRFRELDVAPDGRIVTTVRDKGFHLLGFDPRTGRHWRIAGGCSASFSPDGRRVTNNEGDHQRLSLRDFESGEKWGGLTAPPGLAFDNQFWSNEMNWLVSKSEGAYEDIFIHDLLKDEAVRVTFMGACDRPDLFVESAR